MECIEGAQPIPTYEREYGVLGQLLICGYDRDGTIGGKVGVQRKQQAVEITDPAAARRAHERGRHLKEGELRCDQQILTVEKRDCVTMARFVPEVGFGKYGGVYVYEHG